VRTPVLPRDFASPGNGCVLPELTAHPRRNLIEEGIVIEGWQGMPEWEETTRDGALLWLNDRLGKSVHVSAVIDKGDYSVQLLAAAGELRHWRADSRTAAAWTGHPREDIIGLYEVGDSISLNLSDVGRKAVSTRRDFPALSVELAEDVTFEIVEQTDFLSDEEA